MASVHAQIEQHAEDDCPASRRQVDVARRFVARDRNRQDTYHPPQRTEEQQDADQTPLFTGAAAPDQPPRQQRYRGEQAPGDRRAGVHVAGDDARQVTLEEDEEVAQPFGVELTFARAT